MRKLSQTKLLEQNKRTVRKHTKLYNASVKVVPGPNYHEINNNSNELEQVKPAESQVKLLPCVGNHSYSRLYSKPVIEE